jgi:hypothetical protein
MSLKPVLNVHCIEEGHRTVKDSLFLSIVNRDKRKRQQSAFDIDKRKGKSQDVVQFNQFVVEELVKMTNYFSHISFG